MERISTHQFLMLGAGVTLGTTFLPVGTVVTSLAGRDGWMAVIPAFLFGLPFGLMVLSLAERYPQKNLIQITEQVLGKWIGKIFGILVCVIAAYFGGMIVGQGIDMFSRSILPVTPRWVFIFAGLPLILMMVYAGLEVLARFSEIVFPILVLALVGTALLSIPRFEPGELFPFLENGFKPVLYGVVEIIPWPMEFILFLGGLLEFLPTSQQEIKQMRIKLGYIFLLVGFIDMLITLVEIWVFGPTETARQTYGLLTLGKMIEISRTISGIESIFMMFWMGASIIKISAFYFLAWWGVQSVFKVKRWVAHALIIPIFMVVSWTSVRGADILIAIVQADRYLILPLALVWILLLWGVSTWKQRKQRQSSNGC
ncbi:GerAB/ArcD/ProY family transporter [Desulfitobacterium metallireducens]|uniref:Spore germination protein, amino acid permease n=1 Tax=Desulfitobacterium metallireducens DSM 15288 TaxID=871968 RepID=W0E9H2_9FIRM|nr:endospore germination permease [Desulfitobacterium metallireducens]AHF05686.1 spore germination protein, amino acid permease [Desulfitobacterium metallireducens DSM 15288]